MTDKITLVLNELTGSLVEMVDSVIAKSEPAETGFPQKTVEIIDRNIADFKQRYPRALNKNLFRYAKIFATTFFDTYYGFQHHLEKGNYAPYLHEMNQLGITQYNCTTIIPTIYLYYKTLGFEPKIVQFVSMRDIEDKKDLESPAAGSHFSLIIELGKKHPFLFDPFYQAFGPILKSNKDSLKIGAFGGRKKKVREFKNLFTYTEQEFAGMMQRLKDESGSLDMLAAGQKVFPAERFNKTICNLSVYYQPEDTILTRLVISRPSTSYQMIFCRQEIKKIVKRSLELFLAKDYGWDCLVEGKKVAETNIKELRQIKREIDSLPNPVTKKPIKLKTADRIGPSLLEESPSSKKLLLIVDELYKRLTAQQKEAIYPLTIYRTLYECIKPETNYLHSNEELDARLLGIATKEQMTRTELKPLDDIIFLYGWKLNKLEKSDLRKIRRMRKAIAKGLTETISEVDSLNFLRKDNKPAYLRMMDKVLFSKDIGEKDIPELEEQIKVERLDTRIGYLAMIADFIPIALEAKSELELKKYMPIIMTKIKARQSKT